MTHVITTAMRPPRTAVAALLLVLLSSVILMAISPGTALAAQNNDIRGRVVQTAATDAQFPRNWTQESRAADRNTTTPRGTIKLFVNDNVDGGLCVRLQANGRQLGSTQCWPPGSYGEKIMATNVRAGTRFTVWATKLRSSRTNNDWGGYHTSLNPWRGGYLYY
jgi:hypothetical protein